jgi:hypothetical protein
MRMTNSEVDGVSVDKKKVRDQDQVKQERNLLVETYLKNPMQTRLSIQIKFIDDRVAELTEHLDRQKKSRHGWVVGDVRANLICRQFAAPLHLLALTLLCRSI